MSELIEYTLDDRWHMLRGMITSRRSQVYRSTTDADIRREADRKWADAKARLTELKEITLAREAAGEPPADWDDLVAAVFGAEGTAIVANSSFRPF